jgi:hypothetical protein
MGVPGTVAHPTCLLETIAMNATFRLLIPDKKGIYQRLEAAVKLGSGQVKHSRPKRQMRGMTEAEMDISYENDLLFQAIVASLGRVPGVALLGTPTPIRPPPPSV